VRSRPPVYLFFKSVGSKKYAESVLRTQKGYEKFSRRTLRRWEKDLKAGSLDSSGDEGSGGAAPSGAGADGVRTGTSFLGKIRRRGRVVNNAFEQRVMARLIAVTVINANKEARADVAVKNDPAARQIKVAGILANAFYNYATARVAAVAEQKCDMWKDDESIQKLKFSDHWVKNFIDRFDYSRQKITSVRTRSAFAHACARAPFARAAPHPSRPPSPHPLRPAEDEDRPPVARGCSGDHARDSDEHQVPRPRALRPLQHGRDARRVWPQSHARVRAQGRRALGRQPRQRGPRADDDRRDLMRRWARDAAQLHH
jgi:hypothetical protein